MTPARATVTKAAAAAVAAAVALLSSSLAAPVASAVPAPTPAVNAYYSPKAEAPQSRSGAAFRKFLSTERTEFDLQSYPFFGSLVDTRGRTSTFSLMMQQTNDVDVLGLQLSYAVEGVMVNRGSGFTLGGVAGLPDLTLPLTLTAVPWSIRAQSFTIGQKPQFVDARVVSGRIGEKGAVYELTARVAARKVGSSASKTLQIYVRAKDTLGMAQWGYGPSGFFPQWIYPKQRKAIEGRYRGDVGAYLAGTRDPMSGQGDYYYSSPLLRVQEWSMHENGRRVSHGRGGTLWLDNVEQSFDAAAEKVVKNGVTWTEFSTQLPSLNSALKIGWVKQKSVGTLRYAMLASGSNTKARNGNLRPSKWATQSISIRPVRSARWTSPATGLTYYTKYRVVLRPSGNAQRHSARLTMTAVFDAQEVAFKGGRAVYEGLYKVTGTLDGRRIRGQAWGEVQPAGSL
ncbi:MAG: lipocalin family protein [Candidatus Nanopelagicales bacterium]